MADPVLRLVITENLKTREDLKTYLDLKAGEVAKNLQAAVDDNFVILDQRLNDFAIKLAIKLGIIWFSTTFLAMLTVEIFFRKVYARAIKSRRFQEETTPQTRLTPDMENMVVAIYDNMIRGHSIPVDPHVNPLKSTNDEKATGQVQQPTGQPPTPEGYWQRRSARKAQKRLNKIQAKLIKQEQKNAQKVAKQAPQAPSDNPNITIPDKSYIDHTHDRIQALYERQKIDQARQ